MPEERSVCYSGQRAAWAQSKEMSWASLPCAGGPCTGGCWATGGCCWGGPPEGAICGGDTWPSALLPQAAASHPQAASLEHSISSWCLVLSPVSPRLPREASLSLGWAPCRLPALLGQANPRSSRLSTAERVRAPVPSAEQQSGPPPPAPSLVRAGSPQGRWGRLTCWYTGCCPEM